MLVAHVLALAIAVPTVFASAVAAAACASAAAAAISCSRTLHQKISHRLGHVSEVTRNEGWSLFVLMV